MAAEDPAPLLERLRLECEMGSMAEPVAKGTNFAALNSDTDILAHPGLISRREADIAAKRGIFLEITSRHGHSIANGHVARASMASGALLPINSDSHASKDMIGQETGARIGLGSGLRAPEVRRILVDNPRTFLKRLLE